MRWGQRKSENDMFIQSIHWTVTLESSSVVLDDDIIKSIKKDVD